MRRQVRIRGDDCSDVLELRWARYRKLPLVIEAVQIDEPFEVDTLEGTICGKPGDYLLRGIAGELYPCSADIFHKTYKRVIDA